MHRQGNPVSAGNIAKPLYLFSFFWLLISTMLAPVTALAATADWNADSQHQKILHELSSGKYSFFCKDNCIHKILADYPIIFEDHAEMLVVATTTPPDYGCHACAVPLSFFSFTQQDGKCVLAWQQVAAMEEGSWGEFDPGNLAVQPLATNQYGLFIESAWTGQGISTTYMKVFIPNNNRLEKVLALCTAKDNEGAYEEGENTFFSWRASREIHPVAGKFAEIHFDIVDNVTRQHRQSRFTFDGNAYISRNADPRMVEAYCSGEDD